MRRRDWLVRNGSSERRRCGRAEDTRGGRRVIWWLVMSTVVGATAAVLVVDRRSGAQAFLQDTTGDDGLLAIDVLDTDDLERDLFGRPRFEGWGARSPRLVPAALKKDISLLRRHGNRVRARRRLDLHPAPFPDLPIADDTPPRLDSGHPDPDRLLPASRPVENAR